MGKIHVLDKHVAELIAAGEVVERPSSVVKELVENSIDAGATSVTVEIKHGGVTFLRVTDNGCGIAREDVPTAFLRHATSKVQRESDLDGIGTLGFRGEALASISAVARVELLTRTADELAGTRFSIAGGEEGELDDAGCAAGTTLIVRDLFYNTPARMKFLKKDISESNAVAGVLDRAALSHPEVAFRFVRDGREEMNTPGDGNLKNCIFAVYGKEFTAGLMPLSYEMNGVKVTGFVTKPSAARPNRSMQHFFLNGRYVKSRTAMVALEEGFKGSIMAGKFPACVLHLTISPECVDVNVHPAKIEVRFFNERPIFDAVYHGVKSALLGGDRRPEIPLKRPEKPVSAMGEKSKQLPLGDFGSAGKALPPAQKSFAETPTPPSASLPGRDGSESSAAARKDEAKAASPVEPLVSIPPKTAFGSVRVSDFTAEDPVYRVTYPSALERRAQARETADEPKERLTVTVGEKLPHGAGQTMPPETKEPSAAEQLEEVPSRAEPPAQEPGAPVLAEDRPARVIGEAFKAYLILESGDELLLIDKHAAHERLLYERLKAESGRTEAQYLLEPVTVTLEKNEYAALLEQLPLLAEAGFELEDFGGGTVLVRSAPLAFERADIAASVEEIAGHFAQSRRDVSTEQLDWLYHNIACRAAIKAGKPSAEEELVALVRMLREHPEVRYCPHGRPVYVALTKKELEKQFKRI